MSQPSDEERRTITLLLDQARDGDASATEQVWNELYAEIHKIARGFSAREGNTPTLQPSMLVNEAFIKLFGGAPVDWTNRQHFINTAARAMGNFLIDRARARDSAKRGGGRKAIPLTIAAGELADYQTAHSMHAVQAIDALAALEEVASDAAEVARFRFVLGFSVKETAEITGIAPSTVKKKWKFAKAWMRKHLAEQDTMISGDQA